MLLASTSAYKVSKYFWENGKFQKKDVILQLEAEEDTGSAEEQPASNRFPHYTEIVSGIVIGMAMPLLFQEVPYSLENLNQAALPHGSPKGSSNSVFARLFVRAP